MPGETYRELAAVCLARKYRLLLCSDRDHVKLPGDALPIRNELERLEVRQGDDLLVKVVMRDHTVETAAAVALAALEKAGRL